MTMREILFRGKLPSGAWVYGDLRQYPSGAKAIKSTDFVSIMEVDPSTVGQYTGLTDNNGTKIFEGDIVVMTLPAAKMSWRAVCKFHSGAFGLVWQYMGVDRWQAFAGICNAEYEVLGNIHDNPELMEGE